MQLSYTQQKKCGIILEIYTFYFRVVDWSTHLYCSHEDYQNLVFVSIHWDCWVWIRLILLSWLKNNWSSLCFEELTILHNSCVTLSLLFSFSMWMPSALLYKHGYQPASQMVPMKARITVLKFPCSDMLLDHIEINVLYILDIAIFNFMYTWSMFSITDELSGSCAL
jgi:hypothetical protein